jgi:hypothetical protein
MGVFQFLSVFVQKSQKNENIFLRMDTMRCFVSFLLQTSPIKVAAMVCLPWMELPRRESCHTRDDLDHLGNTLVLTQAYDPADLIAASRVANRRYAEEEEKFYSESTEAFLFSGDSRWKGIPKKGF